MNPASSGCEEIGTGCVSSHTIPLNKDFEVRYRLDSNALLMPVDERWPLLYERALVLASGMLPCRVENSRMLRYSGIPSESIQLLTDKLNVSIQEI